MSNETFPKARRLAVIGGGPIGVEAALYGARLGYEVTLYEAAAIGSNLLSWGHLQMFSPWSMNVSPLAATALQTRGWRHPNGNQCPTGEQFVRDYLEPLGAIVGELARVRLGTRVVAVGRDQHLKGDAISDEARGTAPFRLLLEAEGVERVSHAERVIDATGVYGQHNWLGASGIPAPGERDAAARIVYHLEDYEAGARSRYAGSRVLVVGDGHSAATAVCALARLAEDEPGTVVHWVVRPGRRPPVLRYENDPLPLRDKLARAANRLAEAPQLALSFRSGYVVSEIAEAEDGLEVKLRPTALGHGEPEPLGTTTAGDALVVDRIVALVGYRPDLELGRELQLHTCWATEGPMKLAAALLAGGSDDCLAQSNPGPETLAMPEPGFLWLGHKAYGRNPAFLLRVGHEQIRDAFRLWEADAELDLYAEPRYAAFGTVVD